MNPGDVLDAVVEAVEPYGIYLSAGGEGILVLIPEVSWIRVPDGDCRRFTIRGAVHRVRILRFVPEQGRFLGSIRLAHPELDPWRHADGLVLGSRLSGAVRAVISAESGTEPFGYMIDVPQGFDVFLRQNAGEKMLAHGQCISVVVAYVDDERRCVEVARRIDAT